MKGKRTRSINKHTQPKKPNTVNDYYQLFMINKDAPKQVVRDKWRELLVASAYDKNTHLSAYPHLKTYIETMFRKVSDAGKILLNKDARHIYDDLLQRGELPSHGNADSDEQIIKDAVVCAARTSLGITLDI
jgi:DnaJ-class molecular chaperone